MQKISTNSVNISAQFKALETIKITLAVIRFYFIKKDLKKLSQLCFFSTIDESIDLKFNSNFKDANAFKEKSKTIPNLK